jgi:hypothetical protein
MVSNLAATGSNIHWYLSSSGGASLAVSTALTNGTHYYASQTIGGCESLLRFDVSVTINAPAVPVVNVVNNCGSSILSTAATDSLLWTPGNLTTSQITVTNAGTYYVTQTINGCTGLPGSGVAAPKVIPVVFLGNDTIVCANHSVMLNAGNPGASYSWTPHGQSTQTIVADTSGLGVGLFSFAVQVNLNGCLAADNIAIDFSPCTGIDEMAETSHIILSPNPSHGVFTLSTKGIQGKVSLSIYSMNGQIIYSDRIESFGNQTLTINPGYIAKGVYFIRINSEEKQYTKKLIIE